MSHYWDYRPGDFNDPSRDKESREPPAKREAALAARIAELGAEVERLRKELNEAREAIRTAHLGCPCAGTHHCARCSEWKSTPAVRAAQEGK